MSAHIKRLADAGWLERAEEEEGADRRRVRLRLSAKGAQALSAIRRSRNNWLAARLEGLSLHERRALADALGPLERLVEMKS
jgi:DNA-binding MarR family transcriptional regulator